jgi:predicted transcriptional regulator
MAEQEWVVVREIRREKNGQPKTLGRPEKFVSLKIALDEIVRTIGDEKLSRVDHQLSLLKKARAYVA